ncbi:hypothetical protein HG537_0H04070 [Torulaspora globosa]|uniref:AMP-activated protein kinase glycogen-binding domain-containing protein n=1 Tax=Torulaspora globosa TaxID=48254 RepID=A0A7H9HY24_9SACH|nr:hypothetical protein HG537_0H04070 [Torulaspora sp. CBS 2947]
MSGSTVVDYTFEWPSGPEEVLVTGEFDQWKGTMPLLKTSSGAFELTFPVEIPAGKDKVFFKFIVDGTWLASDAYTKGVDENGIENNYISRNEALALSENPAGTRIPEAGGLVCATKGSAAEDDLIPEPGAYPKTPTDGKSEEAASKDTSKFESEAVESVPAVTGSFQTEKAGAKVKEAGEKEERSAEKPEESIGTEKAKQSAERAKQSAEKSEESIVTEKPEQRAEKSVESAKKPEQASDESTEKAKQFVEKAIETGNPGNAEEPSKSTIPTESATTSAPDPEPASLPKPTNTTEPEGIKGTEAPAKPEPATIPSLTVMTVGPEESNNLTSSGPSDKDVVTSTIITPPPPAGSTAISEVTGSTAATRDTALDTVPTASSSDSKKRFKIKRRFKKNKITGEKTIVSEERIPLDSEESGTEHPLVDEELVASPTEPTAGDVHIMPIGPPAESKNTQFKGLVGEPGLVVPENVTEIKEFTEIRDVDVDELNERLNKQEREKQTPTLDPKSHQNELQPQTSNKLYEVTNGETEPVKEDPEAKTASEKPTTAKNEKKPNVQKPSTTTTTPKQDEKKKKTGFFNKLKKIFH